MPLSLRGGWDLLRQSQAPPCMAIARRAPTLVSSMLQCVQSDSGTALGVKRYFAATGPGCVRCGLGLVWALLSLYQCGAL